MTTPTQDHEMDCLMCAVRALTEGDPESYWAPTTPGENISGVVLRTGTGTGNWGVFPFVDLWLGGRDRIRLNAGSLGFQSELSRAAARVGDRLQVWFEGEKILEKGRMAGRRYRAFRVEVQRGH
jgi:hypothetical protein